jgi:divinyl chlorophyllide a 8-vinyl-reductase
VCFVRAASGSAGTLAAEGVAVRVGDVGDRASIARNGMQGERFDVVVSCMASRTGVAHDAWAIDHAAHVNVLEEAKQHGVSQMVLLSAICVQKPLLAFQHAKLAFEQALMESGLVYSIVRPTAFFKSLSGQVARVQQGKPYLMFGDGTLTACKPISDEDLAEFIATCIADSTRHHRILPIGGPGNAQTPREQGEQLFALLGRSPKFKQVPVALLDTIVGVLGVLGRVIPPLAAKAELARIGRYYATESMLVWDAKRGRYDADATPSTGRDTLAEYHARLIRGEVTLNRGDQAVF